MIDWNQQQQQLQQQQHPLTSISSSSNLNQLGSHQVMVPQSSSSPDQSQMSAGGSNNHSRDSASVEAELDLANRNVKALIKEIETLEALSGKLLRSDPRRHSERYGQGAGSPRKSRRRLQNNPGVHHYPILSNSNASSSGPIHPIQFSTSSLPTSNQSKQPLKLSPEEKRQAEIEIRTLIDQLSVELSDKNLRRLSNLIKSASKSLKGLGHSKIQETIGWVESHHTEPDGSSVRSFGIAPATLSSVAGGGTVTSGGGIMSGVVSVETSSKGGGTGGIGSSGSVSGLTSSLSLITGTSSTSEKNSGGTGSGGANSLSVGGGNSTNSAISGSESTPTSRLLHYSDPRSRLNLINIDDLSFRTLVIETQVLVTKDHTRWNIEKLLELIEGSLYMNPKRLEELTRSTKHTSKYTKLACSTLRTLLSDQVGVKFLSEDKLVEQIGTALRQLDPHSGVSQSETLFTQTRVEDTLTHGYFEMLGVLTKSPDGIKLVLSKALTSSYKHVRLFATHHLEKLISNSEFGTTGPSSFFAQSSLNLINGSSTSLGTSNMSSGIIGTAINLATNLSPSVGNSSSSSNNYNSFISNSSNSTSPLSNTKIWLIRLLLTQLYDPSPEVCGLAVEILEEACTASIEVLETVVQMRPSLENLGDVGVPLLLKFLSTPFGAKYLNEIEWTEREMDEWYNVEYSIRKYKEIGERSRDYVIQLETHLSKSLNADGTKDEEDEELIASADGTPPPHFYGELVKTHEGRKLLNSKGHLKDYVETIKRHGYETFDLNKLSNLKTALWAIGNIGSSVGGLSLLESEDVLKDIVGIAEKGQKKKMKDLYHYHGPSSGESKLYKQITNSIANLSNHLLANNSSRTLSRLRTKYRETFQDLSLFYRAMKILANYHYRFLTRRFVMELFGEIKLDEEVVRKIGSIEESIKLKIRSSSSNSNSNDKVEDFNLKNNDSRKAQGFRANDDVFDSSRSFMY
ncbi:hypothetical protein PPACK8108_LOCUS590 [Phakopsora pachyrhizi]|uniref:Uncharacterized protein n=1 Tax=Phakopsora pachyrhizi TaxID=170000 RepID=A0AAV0AF27_PHAPC|nr:hypothetical protein PPACK8108_LOCUS590 [Phakopsora pachyrhizi]